MNYRIVVLYLIKPNVQFIGRGDSQEGFAGDTKCLHKSSCAPAA